MPCKKLKIYFKLSTILYCVYTMFPAAPAAPFGRNVECCGSLVIYFPVFKIYCVLLRFLTLYYDVRKKPVVISRCVMEELRNGYSCPPSITIISMFYCSLLHSFAVGCLLTRAQHIFFVLSRSATDKT